MPKTYPIQSSFAAGEVSPKLYGRYDQPGYQEGLAECTNTIVDSRGPLIKRSGYEHRLDSTGRDCRLFTFDFSIDEAFIVFFHDLEVIVGAKSADSLGPEQVTNSDFTSGLNAWDSAITGAGLVTDTGQGAITIDPTKGVTGSNSAQISQTLTPDDVTQDQVITVQGQFNSPAATPLRVLVGSTGPGSSDILSANMLDNNTQYQFLIPEASIVGEITITVRAEGWNVGGNPETDSEIVLVSLKEFIPSVPLFTVPAPYPEEDLRAVQAVMHPNGKTMVFTHPNHPVQELVYDPNLSTWVFQLRVLTAEPAEWVVGNYPGVSVFFQGRHWYAGTPEDPEAMWASKSGDYKDMTIGVNADDALKFTLSEHGVIVWMLSGRDLLIGTSRNEFLLTSREGVITPSDVQVEQQSSYGATSIQAQLLGTEGQYISPDRTKLYSMWYQWTEAGYLVRDITYANDHITRKRIRHMVYQKEPEQVIWLTLDDGSLVGCTYHRDGNDKPTYGWHRHTFDGIVLDITPIQQGEFTALVIAVLITIDGEDRIHVMVSEATAQPSGTKIGSQTIEDNDISYVDDFTHIVSDGTDTSVLGLDYLEGKTVQAVVDGAVETPKVVVGGQISLDHPGNNIYVGLPYTSKIVTLPLVTQAPSGGSTAAWTKQRNKIFVRVLNSAKPLINGERPPERTADTPMNLVQPLESADFQVTTLGRDEHAIITVEQDLPKPLNIIAIFGEAAQETL